MYRSQSISLDRIIENLSSTRRKLGEIKDDLKVSKISKKKKKALREEAKELIVKENLGFHIEEIEKKISEGCDKNSIWEYCQIEIDEQTEEIKELEKKIKRAHSKSISKSKVKHLETDLKNYRLLIKGLKKCQNRYCEKNPITSQERKPPQKTNNSKLPSINWCGNEKELRELIKTLKSKSLIEDRETEELVHYVKNYLKETEPINWLQKKTLLAYFLEELTANNYIAPDNIWIDTAPYFLWKGKPVKPKRLNSTADQFKNNKSMKPKGYGLIDDIIEDIKH